MPVKFGELVDPLEVVTHVIGEHRGWRFIRYGCYWSASGPAIPMKEAVALWLVWGKEARAGGDCACREPRPGCYPHTGCYHIDTAEGLDAFRELLDRTMGPGEKDAA